MKLGEERKQCAIIQHVPGRGTIAFEFFTHAISICRFIIVVDTFKHAKNMLNKIGNYEWIEWQIMYTITYRHRAEQIHHWEDITRYHIWLWTSLSQVNADSVRHLLRWYVERKSAGIMVPWLCESMLNAMSMINRQYGGIRWVVLLDLARSS